MESSIVLIYDALYRMGFKANCTGFFYLSYSVYLCICRPGPVIIDTGWLYQKVSRHYGTPLATIQERVRTAVTTAWRTHRQQMEEIAGCPLKKQPRDTEVLAILYRYITDRYFVY